MATANLNNVGDTVDTSKDSIVIVDNFQSVRGGRTLLTTGYTPLVIPAGHPIIEETATGEYKPMPIAGAALAALPAGHTYVGINISTILTTKPFAGILVRGTVNPNYPGAMTYDPSAVLAAMVTALKHIDFRGDK